MVTVIDYEYEKKQIEIGYWWDKFLEEPGIWDLYKRATDTARPSDDEVRKAAWAELMARRDDFSKAVGKEVHEISIEAAFFDIP